MKSLELWELDPKCWPHKKNTSIGEQVLQAHVRDFMEGPKDEWVCLWSNKGTGRLTRKFDGGSEKKKARGILSHYSPQKPAALEGGRKRGRQAKFWADNLKEWTRLAEDRLAWRLLSHNVNHLSPMTTKSWDWSDMIWINR